MKKLLPKVRRFIANASERGWSSFNLFTHVTKRSLEMEENIESHKPEQKGKRNKDLHESGAIVQYFVHGGQFMLKLECIHVEELLAIDNICHNMVPH